MRLPVNMGFKYMQSSNVDTQRAVVYQLTLVTLSVTLEQVNTSLEGHV